MVRSAGGKRITGHDMTKAQVRSHVETQSGRHATPLKVQRAPKLTQVPRRGRKVAKAVPKP